MIPARKTSHARPGKARSSNRALQVILRFQLPHAALALFYGVDHSTITPDHS